MRVTAELLYAVAPGANRDIVNGIVANGEVISEDIPDADLPYWLGQTATETGGFTRIEENLYYTSVKRLRQVWPKRFPTDAAASPYVRNPKRLANLAYGGRLGNRKGSNDGWDYRGSGLKQTTGRYNFGVVQSETGVQCLDTPDLLRSFPSAVTAAVVYWRVNNLTRFVANDNIAGLTKAIQGGQLALRDRTEYTRRAQKAMKQIGGLSPAAPKQTDQRNDWLRKGSTDVEAVKLVQRRLQVHGFYIGGNVDGDFGEGTDKAVREFQTAYELISDGVVGEKTAKALTAAPRTIQTPPPAPTDAPAGQNPPNWLAIIIRAVIDFLASLRKGNRG
jgi:predicted chitinase